MAAATEIERPAPKNPFSPANWEQHQANLDARAEARKKRQREMRRYLDPDVAKNAESRKPLYSWSVKVEYVRPDSDPRAKKRMKQCKHEETVDGQTEEDAWAAFCDQIGVALGPHEGDREIKRLNKIN